MAQTRKTNHRFEELRRRAEELLRSRDKLPEKEFASHYEQILQELDVYHAELEIQNEQLRRSEQQLQLSRDRYADLFERAPVGYLLVGSDGIIAEANESARHILGESKLVRRPLVKFIHDDDLEKFVRHRTSVLHKTQPRSVELRLKNQDGGRTHIWMNSLVEHVEEPRQSYTLVAITDVTDLKAKEAALKDAHRQLERRFTIVKTELGQKNDMVRQTSYALHESERKYEMLVENANESIVVLQDDIIRFANRRLAEVVGEPVKDLPGKPIEPYIHEDDRTWVITYHQARIAEEQVPSTYDFRMIDSNDQIRWMRSNAVLIDWQGRPASLIFLTDITQRRIAEGELELQKNFLQKIMDNIPAMICVFSTNGEVEMTNRAFERRLGWTAEELKDRDVMKTFYPDPELRRRVWDFMQEARDQWRDFPILTRDGEVLKVSWYNARVQDDTAIGIGIDITERKAMEEELRTANEQLRIERNALQQKTATLRELLRELEQQREQVKQQILENYEESILPLLSRLKSTVPEPAKANIEMLQNELSEITSPFVSHLKTRFDQLSPREREICRMIRGGMTGKEIADALQLSFGTVQKHRERIRKKLDLTGAKTNLTTYLQTLDLPD